MSIESPLEEASLSQLQQTPIDNVINIIDEGLVHLPTYRELYYRWERQQWRAQDIDFSVDRKQWEAMSEDEHKMRIFGFSSFFRGEASVTDTLSPYIVALPDEEMRLFLTTQLVDEARHTVFFARFFKEVLAIDYGTLEETLAVVGQNLNDRLHYILVDSLAEVSTRIRQEPGKLAYLVEGITLYHVIVEGMLALAGQRNMLQAYREMELFPAFRAGFTAVARDESRHVIFGVKFLRDMIQQNAEHANVVRATIEKYASVGLDGLTPSAEEVQRLLSLGEDPWVTPRYAIESLQKKIKVIGLNMVLPTVPPPPA